MAKINTIVIEVRLTRDPEVRDTAGGSLVAKLGLVHNVGKKDRNTGQWTNEPLWLDGLAFGKTAEAFSKIGKGDNVVVTGELSQDSWTDKASGQPRSKLVLMINKFSQLGKVEAGNRQPPEPAANDVKASEQELFEATGDEIPF